MDQVEELDKAPTPPPVALPPTKPGRRFNPRLLFIPVVLAAGAFGWWGNRGTTEADDLKPGDCFVAPTDDSEFDRLDTEDCALTHNGQIVARVSIPRSSDDYPSQQDPYWQAVFEACEEKAVTDVNRVDELPEDAFLDFFSPAEGSWESGDRESLCFIGSDKALDGSFVNP